MTVDFAAKQVVGLFRIGIDPTFTFRTGTDTDVRVKQRKGLMRSKDRNVQNRQDFNPKIPILEMLCLASQTDRSDVYLTSANTRNGGSQSVKILHPRNAACHRVKKKRQFRARTRPALEH